MITEKILEIDRQHIWHPYSSIPAAIQPAVVEDALGVMLHLKDGPSLIDGMSSWWSVIHGYNHPTINQVISTQIGKFSHVMFGGLTHEPAAKLTKQLIDLLPSPLENIFYSDSGSVAVEVAIKMALQYWICREKPAKNRLLTIRGGYHGDTFMAMSVCDPENGMHNLFQEILIQQFFADKPKCKFSDEWNPDDIKSLKDLVVNHHEKIAALILEPIVQGAGGMNFYHSEYLRQAQALCKEYDILLIFDEIATGFGRTGKLFALEHANVVPDILCLGKALTAGYLPMAATVCSKDISYTISNRSIQTFMHGPTFMANPTACSVALKSIQILLSYQWQDKIQSIETIFRNYFLDLANNNSVKEIRVLGAIAVIELKQPVDLAKFTPICIRNGIWLRPFKNLIYLMPPYLISINQLKKLCQHTITSLTDYLSGG